MMGLLPRCVRRLVLYVVGRGDAAKERRKRCPAGPWRGFFYHLGCPETDDALIPIAYLGESRTCAAGRRRQLRQLP